MPKLNPNEAPEGYVAKESPPIYACDVCAFFNKKRSVCSRDARTVSCFGISRIDKTCVIFKRKPVKPKQTKGILDKTKMYQEMDFVYNNDEGVVEEIVHKPKRVPREWMRWAVVLKNCEDKDPAIYKIRSSAKICAEEQSEPSSVIRVKITEVV